MKSVLKFELLTIRRIAPSTTRSNIAFFRMLPALVKVWCFASIDLVMKLIKRTKTEKGLRVVVNLIKNCL